jgi:hypothetical protein
MPGQLANFMKNFGKAVYEYAPVIKTLVGGVSAGYDIFNNLSKFDDLMLPRGTKLKLQLRLL